MHSGFRGTTVVNACVQSLTFFFSFLAIFSTFPQTESLFTGYEIDEALVLIFYQTTISEYLNSQFSLTKKAYLQLAHNT